MTSEDQEILEKISQLAGQINRHKNGQTPDEQAQYQPSKVNTYAGTRSFVRPTDPGTDSLEGYHQSRETWQPRRGGYSSRGSLRGGRVSQVHRHRTLILNGNNSTSTTPEREPNDENANPSTQSQATGSAWVSKTDRHLQLINTSVFEKESQQRAKAMEQTRQQRLKQKDEREKARFAKHLQRSANNAYSSNGPGTHEIELGGIRFLVTKNGSKLKKIPGENSHTATNSAVGEINRSIMNSRYLGDANAAKATPKTTLVGGVRFFRSKNGNMYRAGVIKAHRSNADTFDNRRKAGLQKIQEPCKTFTTTASVMRTNITRSDQSAEDETSDISSDEEGEEIGDDDVDSDDLEEFIGDEDGNIDSDIPMQQDYVQLS
ncbi:hypothetical protein EG329_014353 [Mollisiaceae sp. DMI_Dod_QoI]|nr:hypothetical protein EG329_014353 [Helotiales sp. DMI_Dod_QoI]